MDYKDLIGRIKSAIKANGIQYKYIKDLLDVAKDMMFNDYKDREYIFKVSKYVRDCCEYSILNGNTEEFTELYWNTLKFEAPYLLDSYLLYVERNREPKEKFYQPRRKQFLKLGLIQGMQDLEDDKLDLLSLSVVPGAGKAQPMYSKVLTPKGFKEMGDIKVGDTVISGTGKESKVLGVYPQGYKHVYEITFNDGSKCRCSDEHIWRVQSRADRRVNRYRDLELKQIMPNLTIGSDNRLNYSIDYVPKIDFTEKEYYIHPYLMGVILGDGSLASGGIKVTNPDKEILDKVREVLPKGYTLQYISRYDYNIKWNNSSRDSTGRFKKSELRKEFERYGLYSKKSKDKFIPKEYLNGSHEQRLWLLRGLLDTDGSVSKSVIEYSTVSERLATDVIELVHSLGGYASVARSEAGYKDPNGNYIKCNDTYRIVIQFYKEMEAVFYLTRKKELYKPKRERRIWKRFIKDIQYIGEEGCQCIYIDDPSHLYITDDYLITHNTTAGEFFLSWVMGRHPEDYSLMSSHSGDITKMFYESVYNIITSAEYCWGEIFPNVQIESNNAKMETINLYKFKPFKTLQCRSVGSKNAGVVRCNRYLYCDDLVGGIEEAVNKVRLDTLWSKYSVDLRQRKKDGCKEIHFATRWSVHDVIGRLQKKYEGDERALFIAVPDIDPDTGESNFDYDYNVGFTAEYFNDVAETMDDVSYRCLYKNQPIEREGLLYNEDELRRYLTLPLEEPDAILGICDTKDKGTDFMFMPVMYQYGTDYYMVDCICDDNADYGVQYERLSNMIVEHKMQKCEFESNNGGSRVGYDVSKLVEKKNGRCSITTNFTSTNKETKIIVNADWVKKHVLFKDKSMYTKKSDYGRAIEFLVTYTLMGKNPHDDVPDGLAQFALFVTERVYATVTAVQRPF